MEADGRPPFDHAKAAEMIGKYVIIGMTFNDCNDNFLRQEQYHGIILSAEEGRGIEVALKGANEGET